MRRNKLRRTQVSDELISEKMSVRSINLCKYNDLNDLQSLLAHYSKFGSFLNLRNCGHKSNDELVAICRKSLQLKDGMLSFGKRQGDVEILNCEYFNEVNLKLLDAFILEHMDFLSNRSFNALSAYLQGDFTFQNFHFNILNNNKFSFRNIRNVGSKSLFELEKFIETLQDFVLALRNDNLEVDSASIQEKYFFPRTFFGLKIPEEINDSKSVFKLVDFLIRNNSVFGSKENVIFQASCKVFNDQAYSSDVELSEKLGVSRERVRQLRQQILVNVESKFDFVKDIVDNIVEKVDLDSNQNLIIIDENISNDINRVNGTNFTVAFNAVILSILHQRSFKILGDIRDILAAPKNASASTTIVRNCYLINHYLFGFFNFYEMCLDIQNRLVEKIVESYSLHFIAYLSRFSIKSESAFVMEIKPIAEQMINLEFDLFLDFDDNLVFEKNSAMTHSDLVVDALEKIGEPAGLEEIFNKLNSFSPNAILNKEAIRSIIHRTPEIICISRSGRYGLRAWEAQERGIKGGTIRRMVVEFLKSNLEPVHISNIASHVIQFRPTSNEKSIYHNLKLDESNTFVFFKDSFVGLVERKYDCRYQVLVASRTRKSGFSLDELIEFIRKKNRLPDSRKLNEAKLYRFYYRTKKKLEQDDSNSELEVKLKRLIEKFGTVKRHKYSIEQLKEFIKINNRMPDSRSTNERGLYQFAYKQRRQLEKEQ